jgi:hypothetical protein
LDSLKKEVEADGHVMTTTMLSLRNGFGYGRLGPHVAQFISGRLASAGLGHAPSPLPLDQFQTVLIYTLGSPVANLVDAALRPSEAGAKALRNAGGGQAADLLAQIKALVCE